MKSDATYLHHILEMIDRMEAATTDGKEAFLASRLHQDAVLRNLQTLTEATQRLSPELKASYADIEW